VDTAALRVPPASPRRPGEKEDTNLAVFGSIITIDKDLLDASALRVGQKVEIVNVNNGERFSTYVIKGKRGSKEMCLNGAAARKVEIGDKIIVIAYASYCEDELETYKPIVVHVDDKNSIIEITNELIGSAN